jgi:hypothetical protein
VAWVKTRNHLEALSGATRIAHALPHVARSRLSDAGDCHGIREHPSIGCFRGRIWGWWLAVAILLVNGLSDVAQIFMGHFLEGGIGVVAAGVILFYLSRPNVRGAFKAQTIGT